METDYVFESPDVKTIYEIPLVLHKQGFDKAVFDCLNMKNNNGHKDIIVLESTVFPGLTENIVSQIIVKKTNLKLNKDFFLGYSPEELDPNHYNVSFFFFFPSNINMQIIKL